MIWNRLLFIILAIVFSAPVLAEDERVQVGDMVQVNLPGEETLNKGFQVDKRGRINLPEVGALYVAGYTEEQLEKAVLDALGKVYRDLSTASVYIAEQQILISIQGYVNSPGEYTLSKSSDVQMAIHAAGGLRSGAQLDNLLLKRGKEKFPFNYKSFLDTGDETLLPTQVTGYHIHPCLALGRQHRAKI